MIGRVRLLGGGLFSRSLFRVRRSSLFGRSPFGVRPSSLLFGDRRRLLGDFVDNSLSFGSGLGGRSFDFGGDDGHSLFFLGRGSGFSSFGFLGRALLDPLLRLLARLGFLRVVTCRALADAGGIKEAQDAVRGLGAYAEPMLDWSASSFTRSGESFASSGL